MDRRGIRINIRPMCPSNSVTSMRHSANSPATPTDSELVERWRQGDERAATLLVERHAEALARFAFALGVRQDVEDLVQETFIKAFSSLPAFRGESSLTTWLFTIERRLVLDRNRSPHRHADAELVPEVASREASALDVVMAKETHLRLRQAIAALRGLQREVFVLRVSEGLSYRDIAGTLGTTEGAARVHYHNAVRNIREQLDE